MVITLARGRAERGERERGVIEWGHTHTHIHLAQRWPLNCTASTRKMIVPIARRRLRRRRRRGAGAGLADRMAHQGSGQSKVIKWRIIYDDRSTCPDRPSPLAK